jgi:hypothetical protein
MNEGISSTQPPHSVAQKSRSTTFPRNFDKVVVLPEASESRNAGAASRRCGSWIAARMRAGSLGAADTQPSVTANSRAKAAHHLGLYIIAPFQGFDVWAINFLPLIIVFGR